MLYDGTLTSVRLIVVNRVSRKVSRETAFGTVIAMNVIVVRKSFTRARFDVSVTGRNRGQRRRRFDRSNLFSGRDRRTFVFLSFIVASPFATFFRGKKLIRLVVF